MATMDEAGFPFFFVLFSSHLIHYLDSHAKKLGMIDGGLTFVRGVLEG